MKTIEANVANVAIVATVATIAKSCHSPASVYSQSLVSNCPSSLALRYPARGYVIPAKPPPVPPQTQAADALTAFEMVDCERGLARSTGVPNSHVVITELTSIDQSNGAQRRKLHTCSLNSFHHTPSYAQTFPMALIQSWLPPSREHWQLLQSIWQFFPIVCCLFRAQNCPKSDP